ncbi:hypothetical protein ACQPZQ_14190 [Pseudonocardia sp. CA-142604]
MTSDASQTPVDNAPVNEVAPQIPRLARHHGERPACGGMSPQS